MGAACRVFETPVTGGNVSFYNESPDTSVFPTPVIGMVGLVEDLSHVTTANFKEEGDSIFLLGEDFEEMGGSEYLKVVHNLVTGDAPEIDLEKEKSLQRLLLKAIQTGIIKSAHDISEGGILTALAECCIIDAENTIGAEVNIPVQNREDFSFFSESQSRVIVSVSKENEEKLAEIFNGSPIKVTKLGAAGGNALNINGKYSFPMEELLNLYFNSIPEKMNV